jgi:hypothetical protein
MHLYIFTERSLRKLRGIRIFRLNRGRMSWNICTIFAEYMYFVTIVNFVALILSLLYFSADQQQGDAISNKTESRLE